MNYYIHVTGGGKRVEGTCSILPGFVVIKARFKDGTREDHASEISIRASRREDLRGVAGR